MPRTATKNKRPVFRPELATSKIEIGMGSDAIQDDIIDGLKLTGLSDEEIHEFARYIVQTGVTGRVSKIFDNEISEILADWYAMKEGIDLDDPFAGIRSSRLFERIGAAFIGEEEIVEEETNEYYVPSSPYCLRKAFDYLKQQSPNYVKDEIPKDRRKQYVLTTRDVVKSINIPVYTISKVDPKTPRTYNLCDKVQKKSCAKIKDTTQYPFLLLVRTNYQFYHAVVIKKPMSSISLQISYPTKIEDDVQYPVSGLIKTKEKHQSVIVWDIETRQENKQFIPYAVGYTVLNFTEHKLTKEEAENQEYYYFWGNNCMDEFLYHLEGNEKVVKGMQMFAHNSGGFDTYFILRNLKVTIESELYVSGKFRSLTFKIKDKSLIAKDSFSFFSMSLERLNISTNNNLIKLSDTKIQQYKTEQQYEDNKDIILRYLKVDVLSLAESLNTVEQWFRGIDQSITTSLGAPGLAMNYWMSTQLPECLYCPKSVSIRHFQRQSVYGGRVLHQYKEGKNLICFDANSLYPSAMTYDYPVGRYTIGEGNLDDVIKAKKHFIAEVELDGHNIPLGIIPYRADKSSGLTYPSNKFRGVYTSPDIYSALAAGYTIDKVHQYIYWDESRPIFKDFIEKLYKRRNELKAEKNAAQETYKLILNSFFGKFLERVDRNTRYISAKTGMKCKGNNFRNASYGDNAGVLEPLPNGQFRFRYKHYQALKRPTYIGAFVLSYARSIMNKLYKNKEGTTGIIRMEDVHYGDTDSIYAEKDKVDYSKADTCIDDMKLGYLKNDYGDNTIVEEAMFLDYKRYYLKLKSEGKPSAEVFKFNGFSFKGMKDAKQQYEIMLNGGKVDLPRDQWSRSVLKGVTIDEDGKMKLHCPADKTNWFNENGKLRAYSKDFDNTKPSRQAYYENWLFESKEDDIRFVLKKNKVVFKEIPWSPKPRVLECPATNMMMDINNNMVRRFFENDKIDKEVYIPILGHPSSKLKLKRGEAANVLNKITQIIAAYEKEKEATQAIIDQEI